MTKNTKKLAAISIAAAASFPLFGISGEQAPISGSHVIDGDLSIRFRPSSMYADGWGIKADAGERVSSSGPWTVMIDFLEADYAAGADAEIETSGANSDAVVANNGASVTIGANARITTRGAGASGAYSGVGSSASGAVGDSLLTIMDGAAIETFGDNSDAALARAASGRKAALVLGDRAELATSGIGAYGIAAYYEGASALAGDETQSLDWRIGSVRTCRDFRRQSRSG